MKTIYKSFVLFLMVSILIFPFGCMNSLADEAVEASVVGSNVATEYADADLYTPLDEVTETLASMGSVSAKSAILMEVSTGQVLFEQNADERLAPASITKIMSLLLIMEAIDAGKFALDTQVCASEYACSMGGSQIWLEPNETMTVDELLKAAVIASANDAMVALAELVAGTEEAFVDLMNNRAAELGMVNTTFHNATGLDSEGHLTTARDVALMSCELLKHDLIKNYSTVWMDSLRGGQSELVNTNKLVRFYEGATGLKTGTTSTAGHCLSASAMRDNMEIVAVVMGCESSKDRFNSARQMLDFGFASWAKAVPDISAELNNTVKVNRGVSASVSIRANSELSLIVPKGREGDICKDVSILESVDAPIQEGQEVGEIVLTLDDEEIGRVSLVAAQTVEKMSFATALGRLFSILFAL